MTRRLSSYPEIVAYRRKHKGMHKVDWYRLRDRCVHIIHEGGCQRSMTADGLCSCLDPETYETELDPSDVPGQEVGVTAPRVSWRPGPPPGRGLWWVIWRGVVCAVAIDPALINRGDPNARLLIKGMTGLAFGFDTERRHITYHAEFEHPEAP